MINAYVSRVKTLSSTYSSFDNVILNNNWKSIYIPFKGVLIGKMPKHQARRDILWKPPDFQNVKLNFDGASKDGTNNLVEARALLCGVRIALQLGVQDLHIEGDSQIVTSSLISKKVVNWELQYVLQEVWRLLPRFLSYRISHCFREANKFIDWLSNLGVQLDIVNWDYEYTSVHWEMVIDFLKEESFFRTV
ncbi:hypothetical protein SUGI_0565350 [Cryptomeria japonica]|nr:hypothetical protein SUGI_0565350 [Cryptomeria japonica]